MSIRYSTYDFRGLVLMSQLYAMVSTTATDQMYNVKPMRFLDFQLPTYR